MVDLLVKRGCLAANGLSTFCPGTRTQSQCLLLDLHTCNLGLKPREPAKQHAFPVREITNGSLHASAQVHFKNTELISFVL